jgi:hypothetical protein
VVTSGTIRCWLLTVVRGLGLGVTGCSSLALSGPPIDNTTPQAVCKTFREAYERREFGRMLQCFDPEYRGQIRGILEVEQERWDLAQEVAQIVADRYGYELGKEFLECFRPGISEPLGEAVTEGKVNWSEVSYETTGQRANIVIRGEPTWDYALRKMSGGWYITPSRPDPPGTRVITPELYRAFAGEDFSGLRDLRRELKDGHKSRDDVIDIVSGSWALEDGPPTDGVRLQICLGGRERVLRHAGPRTFRAAAGSSDPVYWKMPTCGLGDGILLELDGNLVPQPDARRDVLRGIPEVHLLGNRVCEWWFNLPPELELSWGVHTIRYSVVSPGGPDVREDGRPVRILKGTLASNTFKFIVR